MIIVYEKQVYTRTGLLNNIRDRKVTFNLLNFQSKCSIVYSTPTKDDMQYLAWSMVRQLWIWSVDATFPFYCLTRYNPIAQISLVGYMLFFCK